MDLISELLNVLHEAIQHSIPTKNVFTKENNSIHIKKEIDN